MAWAPQISFLRPCGHVTFSHQRYFTYNIVPLDFYLIDNDVVKIVMRYSMRLKNHMQHISLVRLKYNFHSVLQLNMEFTSCCRSFCSDYKLIFLKQLASSANVNKLVFAIVEVMSLIQILKRAKYIMPCGTPILKARYEYEAQVTILTL